MAPTELAAVRAARCSIFEWFRPLGVSVGWLTGSMKAQPRRTMLEQLRNGSCQIVVGTHALFQEEIVFERDSGWPS